MNRTFIVGILVTLSFLDTQSLYSSSLVEVYTPSIVPDGISSTTEDGEGGYNSISYRDVLNDYEANTEFMRTRAGAYVSLASGKLGAIAVGEPGKYGAYTAGGATARASFDDNIYFTDFYNRESIEISLNYHIHGIVILWEPNSNTGAAQAYVEHYLYTSANGAIFESGDIKLFNGGYTQKNGIFLNNYNSQEYNRNIRETFTLHRDSNGIYTLGIDARLGVVAQNGANADFSNTGSISFDLPEGITFTSESGFFLTEQQTPVPEPATMILLSTGLAGLAAARRRKKVS